MPLRSWLATYGGAADALTEAYLTKRYSVIFSDE
jgi:hypothetical protein